MSSINDESFIFLTHDAKKVAIENSNECHTLKIQPLPIKATSDSSHFIKLEASKTLDGNPNTWWKPVDLGHDGGEWVSYETLVPCYPVYADILFRDSHKRYCNFIISGLDESDPAKKKEVNMFMGGNAPASKEGIPSRALCNPIKTRVIKIKTIDYTIGEDKKHVYPNPDIVEVRLFGYVLEEFNPKLAIKSPPFTVCPEGYYRDTKTGECTPKLDKYMIAPTAISSYSAISDDEVTKINHTKGSEQDIRNLIKLPVSDKYSVKGKGSVIWQEFDYSDTKKYSSPAVLEAIKLQAFQCPVRDYRILVRIHNMVGLKTPNNFDCNVTVFQKIVDVQCGNGAPLHIPLDGFNDSVKNTKKTVSLTLLHTNQPKEWFSLTNFYVIGQRETDAPVLQQQKVTAKASTTTTTSKNYSSKTKI